MKTYATLGPACCRADLLTELLDMGLTGFRLNLSHTTLAACRPWTEAVQQARATSGRPAELIVDMRGPELRMGPLSRPVTLTAGETVTLGPGGLPVEPDILAAVAPGQEILLDDGLMALRAETCGRAVTCTVTRGGVLESRKSITLPGVELCRPALTEQDLLDRWPKDGNGEFETPAFLTDAVEAGGEAELLCQMLRSYDIPVLRRYEKDGTLGKVVLGFSGYGVKLYVPASRLEEARELMKPIDEAAEKEEP